MKIKWFGRRKKAQQAPPPQADIPTIQAHDIPMPAVDTGMATHIGTRDYQQDAVFVSPPAAGGEDAALAVLCDGMGGMSDGEAASSEVVSFVANALSDVRPEDDVPARLMRAVLGANDMLLAFNRDNGVEAGTTLCIALILGESLFWAGVGDSRIYLLRGGEMARLTRDHNYAVQLQRMVENGQISQQQADSDPNREALVSYIGAPVLEELDISKAAFALQRGDLVLLCSDGLTKALSDEAILRLLQDNAAPLRQTATLLTASAFDSSPGAKDNTSVILMRYYGASEAIIPEKATTPEQEVLPGQQNQRSDEDESCEV